MMNFWLISPGGKADVDLILKPLLGPHHVPPGEVAFPRILVSVGHPRINLRTLPGALERLGLETVIALHRPEVKRRKAPHHLVLIAGGTVNLHEILPFRSLVQLRLEGTLASLADDSNHLLFPFVFTIL